MQFTGVEARGPKWAVARELALSRPGAYDREPEKGTKTKKAPGQTGSLAYAIKGASSSQSTDRFDTAPPPVLGVFGNHGSVCDASQLRAPF